MIMAKKWIIACLASIGFAVPYFVEAQCIKHAGHEIVSAIPLEEGGCLSTVELCLQKSTSVTYEMDFQINFMEGALDKKYNVSTLPTGEVLCHTFEFISSCDVFLSLTGYGRTIDKEFCGVWSTLMALPVDLVSFQVKKVNENEVCLEWEVAQEIGIDFYKVQRSNNGHDFNTLDQVVAQAENMDHMIYEWCDHNPADQDNLYRLVIIENDGRISYSQVVSADQSEKRSEASLDVFPVPSSSLVTIKGRKGRLKAYTVQGQEVELSLLSNDQVDISAWSKGLYWVEDDHGQRAKLLKQ